MPESLNLATDLDQHPVASRTSIAGQVPVIDIASLVDDASGEAAAATVAAVAEACRSWGFFQVVNHGIAPALIERVWQQTRYVFALPAAQKQAIIRSRENPWGFYNNELTKNQRDKKEVFDFTREGVDPIYQQSNRWPAEEIEFKSTMQEYFAACTRLSLTLLEGFCVGLQLPAKYMHDDFASNHTGFVRLNYYPVSDPMSGQAEDHQTIADLGVHHHTDAGVLTVLMQDDVGGLQVYRDGYWHDIPPIDGAMVINTGDMMQVWSNDRYQAAIHRVLAMENKDRYSIPFFFNPAASANVSPLPTVIHANTPAAYHDISWAAFRGKRTDGDFADYGTEVQIAQFRK
ncbi:MAG: isopenicillin N synthase-like dioxygenase [Planctomycetota bacterium]